MGAHSWQENFANVVQLFEYMSVFFMRSCVYTQCREIDVSGFSVPIFMYSAYMVMGKSHMPKTYYVLKRRDVKPVSLEALIRRPWHPRQSRK